MKYGQIKLYILIKVDKSIFKKYKFLASVHNYPYWKIYQTELIFKINSNCYKIFRKIYFKKKLISNIPPKFIILINRASYLFI